MTELSDLPDPDWVEEYKEHFGQGSFTSTNTGRPTETVIAPLLGGSADAPTPDTPVVPAEFAELLHELNDKLHKL